MTVGQFISLINRKLGSLGNIDIFDDSIMILFIQLGLSEIEAYMDWSFLTEKKELVPDLTGLNYDTGTQCYKVLSIIGTDSNGKEFPLNTSNYPTQKYDYAIRTKSILTFEEYTKIDIIANFGFNYTISIEDQLPIPAILNGALFNKTLAYCFEAFLDNGYVISDQHDRKGNSVLELAAKKESILKKAGNVTAKNFRA